VCTGSEERPKLVKLKVKLEGWVCIVGNVKSDPTDRPDCFMPNDSAYPLCIGESGEGFNCSECCLYENYGPPESYYER